MTVAEVYDYGDDDTEPLTSHHMEEEAHLDLPDICSNRGAVPEGVQYVGGVNANISGQTCNSIGDALRAEQCSNRKVCLGGPVYALMRGICFLLLMALACVQLEEKYCLQNLLQLQLF